MHDPQRDLTSLFRRAFEVLNAAERDGEEVAVVRARIARLAQQMGVADPFASSLHDIFAAEARVVRSRYSPEQQGEIERLAELNRIAKQRFLDGDQHGAEEAYLSAEDLRDDHERHGLLGAHVAFHGWLLEAGDLSRSISFYRGTNWGWPGMQVGKARKIADALDKAGRRPDGLDLLRSLRPAPDATDAHVTLRYLGEALWAIGETEEGVATIREAARVSLLQVAQGAKVPYWGSHSEPIPLAELQCTIADCEGAVETLKGVLGLAVPIEYDPPRPRPPDLAPNALWLFGPTLKPAAERWISWQPHLIRVLARAGLDTEAFSLVASARPGQLKLLEEVVRGQARRGAYTEAFRTLDRMKWANLVEANEPSQVTIKPDGTISVFRQTSPIRPTEALERDGAVRNGLGWIRRYAADAGDADTFQTANKLYQQYPDRNPAPTNWESDVLHLELFVRRGEFDQALTAVEMMSPPQNRLGGLWYVMESIEKASRSTRDDVLAGCYR